MRKFFTFLFVICLALFTTSCNDNKKDISETLLTEYITEVTSSDFITLNNETIIITRPGAVSKTEIESTEEQESVNEDETKTSVPSASAEGLTGGTVDDSAITMDNRAIYEDYIFNNETVFLENNGEKNSYAPIYTYIDLDNDSYEELVLFVQFSEAGCASVFMLDVIDGEVKEIISSTYVAPYRTADKFAVFTDSDGKYYIRRTNNDGLYSHMTTVYSYNGTELIPVYSISGCYNEPSYFLVSDNGGDAFDSSDTVEFREVSEEEFSETEKKLCSNDSDVFNSSDIYA